MVGSGRSGDHRPGRRRRVHARRVGYAVATAGPAQSCCGHESTAGLGTRRRAWAGGCVHVTPGDRRRLDRRPGSQTHGFRSLGARRGPCARALNARDRPATAGARRLADVAGRSRVPRHRGTPAPPSRARRRPRPRRRPVAACLAGGTGAARVPAPSRRCGSHRSGGRHDSASHRARLPRTAPGRPVGDAHGMGADTEDPHTRGPRPCDRRATRRMGQRAASPRAPGHARGSGEPGRAAPAPAAAWRGADRMVTERAAEPSPWGSLQAPMSTSRTCAWSSRSTVPRSMAPTGSRRTGPARTCSSVWGARSSASPGRTSPGARTQSSLRSRRPSGACARFPDESERPMHQNLWEAELRRRARRPPGAPGGTTRTRTPPRSRSRRRR